MYATFAVVLFAATSVLGAATVKRGGGSCNTGPVQCCDTVQQPGSENYASTVKSLLGLGLLKDMVVPIQGLAVPIAANCVPATIIGGQIGQDCQGTTTCCDHVNNYGYGLNCVPVNVNL